MSHEIKFGTDGWRAVIANDFTFENVRRVVGAIASYVLNHEDAKRGVVVGYDTRYASKTAARIAAEILAQAGISVFLANDSTRNLWAGRRYSSAVLLWRNVALVGHSRC